MSAPAAAEAHYLDNDGYTHETAYGVGGGIHARCGARGPDARWSARRGPVDCSECLAVALLDAVRTKLTRLRASRGPDWAPWLLLGAAVYDHLARSRVFAEGIAFMMAPGLHPVAVVFGCRVAHSDIVDAHGWHLVDPVEGGVLAR